MIALANSLGADVFEGSCPFGESVISFLGFLTKLSGYISCENSSPGVLNKSNGITPTYRRVLLSHTLLTYLFPINLSSLSILSESIFLYVTIHNEIKYDPVANLYYMSLHEQAC